MKKIITKNKDNLQSNIISLEVDENNLDFINDLAVAKVNVKYLNQYSNHKYCIINKRYEEAFTYSEENDPSKILTLSSNNINIQRLTEFDFIVTTIYSYCGHSTKKNIHIKLDNGVPKIMNNNLYKIQISNCPNIIISDGQLYNIKTGQFISRKYHYIEEINDSKFNQSKFFVIDKIIIDNELSEYLNFVIDKNDNIISPIYSNIELDMYIEDISDLDYEQIKSKRKLELETKKEKSNQLIKKLKNGN